VPDPLDRIRELVALLEQHGLTAISASWAGVRVRLERAAAPSATAPLPAAPAPEPVVQPSATPSHVTVEAPIVVKEGHVLCIIEAMKLMNEIEAKLAGRVVKILADNGAPVEFGQALFLIEPLR
jgi:biotin carboxyl carrier protein